MLDPSQLIGCAVFAMLGLLQWIADQRPSTGTFVEDVAWLWRKATSWDIVGYIVAAMWTFGGLMAGSHLYTGTRVLFMAGGVILLVKLIAWVIKERQPGRRLGPVLLGSLAIVIAVWGEFIVAGLIDRNAKLSVPSTHSATLSEEKETKDTVTAKAAHANRGNAIPREIIERWRKGLPRQWRKHPLGQDSAIGLHQVFDAGVCDGGINDLTREIPGFFQKWGLRNAQFGCDSNQLASPGTLDFDPKIFSYASTDTLIPRQFSSPSMAVSIVWYASDTKGYVKWRIDTACVRSEGGQSVDAELTNGIDITDQPRANDSGRQITSSGSFGVPDCKGGDMLILRLARRGDNDTLMSTVHVNKVSIDLKGNARVRSFSP